MKLLTAILSGFGGGLHSLDDPKNLMGLSCSKIPPWYDFHENPISSYVNLLTERLPNK